MIIKVYAALIRKGKKTLSEVSDPLREAVEAELNKGEAENIE